MRGGCVAALVCLFIAAQVAQGLDGQFDFNSHHRRVIFHSHVLDTETTPDISGIVQRTSDWNLHVDDDDGSEQQQHHHPDAASFLQEVDDFDVDSAQPLSSQNSEASNHVRVWLVHAHHHHHHHRHQGEQQQQQQQPFNVPEHLSQQTGGVVFGYIPHNTYLLAGSRHVAQAAAQLKPLVKWVGRYPAKAKLTSSALALLRRNQTSASQHQTSDAGSLLDENIVDGNVQFDMVRNRTRFSASSTSTSLDLLVQVVPTLPVNALLLKSLRELVFQSTGQPEGEGEAKTVQVTAASSNSIQITLPASLRHDQTKPLLHALALDPRVFSIEHLAHHQPLNKFAQWILQSAVDGSRDVWFGPASSSSSSPTTTTTTSSSSSTSRLRGENQLVGLADSGLDMTHCFFYDPASPAAGPTHRKVHAYYVMPGADESDDPAGHGTHTAGSLAGDPLEGSNPRVSQYGGLAPKSRLVFHDIGCSAREAWCANPGKLTVPVALGEYLFEPAYEAGARVHSDSWGCGGPTPEACESYNAHAKEVDDFVWRRQDFLIVFAAGNDGTGPNAKSVSAPATAKNALVVGASQSSFGSYESALDWFDWPKRQDQVRALLKQPALDCCATPRLALAVRQFCCKDHALRAIRRDPTHHSFQNVADFSSRGPTFDGRVKPEVMAPGQYVVSARAKDPSSFDPPGQCSDDGSGGPPLLAMAGTSMAAPLVAGAAALVRQYFTEGYYPLGKPSPDHVITPSAALMRAVLVNSAQSMNGEVELNGDGTNWVNLGSTYPPSSYQGYGRVQLDRTLKFPESNFELYIDDGYHSGQPADPPPFASSYTGIDKNYCFVASITTTFKVTLVWSDYPAQLNARVAAVNNLDLIVGRSARDLQTGNFQTRRDERNNIEQVIFANVRKGEIVRVKVRGWHVPMGPQPYALVVTGKFLRSRVTTSTSSVDAASHPTDACIFEVPFDKIPPQSQEAYFSYQQVIYGSLGVTLALVFCIIIRAYCSQSVDPEATPLLPSGFAR